MEREGWEELLYISKSKYLTGLQCPKSLWINYNAKSEIPEVDDFKQAIFDQGQEVGEWAKKVFPDGIDIDWNAGFKEVLNQSGKMLSERKPLFEPGFVGDSTYSRIDILNPVGADEWDIIEVKSTTNPTKSKNKIDEVYLHDISFQKYCCLRSGLKIRNTYLMYINRQYIKEGDIDPGELFIIEDVTDSVNNFIDDVEENVEHMLKIIKYVNERGSHAIVPKIEQPPKEFDGIKQIFEAALEHEQMVTHSINDIVGLCLEEKDYSTHNWIQWFVDEQLEEESSVNAILDKLEMLGDKNIYIFDRDIMKMRGEE